VRPLGFAAGSPQTRKPWELRRAPSLRSTVPSCLRTLWLNVLRGAVQFDGAVAKGRAGEPATLLAPGGHGNRIALDAAGAAERQLFFKSLTTLHTKYTREMTFENLCQLCEEWSSIWRRTLLSTAT